MSFFDIISHNTIEHRLNRLSYKLAESDVQPHVFIQGYLDKMSHRMLTEAFMGNFFKRLSNAWQSFWKKPQEGNPEEKFDAAKEALEALVMMVKDNKNAGGTTLHTILNGLEQALNILNHIEPPLKQYSQQIMQHQSARQTGTAFTPSIKDVDLPDDLQSQYDQIMDQFEAIDKSPNTRDKLDKLKANGVRLQDFMNSVQQQHQSPQGKDPQRQQQLEKFLQVMDTDAAFREVQQLLSFARQRSGITNRVLQWPQGYQEVINQWNALGNQDENQKRNSMLQWYARLPLDHPIKKFILDELQNTGQDSNHEQELFWQYAMDWISLKMSHLQNAQQGLPTLTQPTVSNQQA